MGRPHLMPQAVGFTRLSRLRADQLAYGRE